LSDIDRRENHSGVASRGRDPRADAVAREHRNSGGRHARRASNSRAASRATARGGHRVRLDFYLADIEDAGHERAGVVTPTATQGKKAEKMGADGLRKDAGRAPGGIIIRKRAGGGFDCRRPRRQTWPHRAASTIGDNAGGRTCGHHGCARTMACVMAWTHIGVGPVCRSPRPSRSDRGGRGAQ